VQKKLGEVENLEANRKERAPKFSLLLHLAISLSYTVTDLGIGWLFTLLLEKKNGKK